MNARMLALAAAIAALSPLAADAATVKFCISHTGSYGDSGVAGEDFWTDASAKLARGAFFEVEKGGVSLFSSFLGDGLGAGDPGIGCTSDITVASANGTYDLTVSSYGWGINGNDVEAYDNALSLWGASSSYVVSGGAGTYNVTITVSPGTGYNVLNVYQAGAYAMYRHNGGNSGEVFKYRAQFTGGSGSSYDGTYINIATSHTDNKFVIIHEAGHRMADLRTGGVMNDAQSYSWTEDAECRNEPTGTPHSMRSMEYSGAAAGEGFGHFYAADVFNDHDETDCWFEYYKEVDGDSSPAVNCETSNTDFDLAYLENVCGAAAGSGVELDWLRTYWDVHTDNAAPDPTFTAMTSWLAGAAAEANWDRDTAYQELDEEANELDDELESNWNNAKTLNGVDH